MSRSSFALVLMASSLSTAHAADQRNIVWGVIGTGSVAHDFAKCLHAASGCTLKAVGSRTIESANSFADEESIDVRYGSYEELVADDEIDIVYIASPTKHHVDHSELCLRAGKAVLCEKTMATDSAGAKRVLDLAAERKLLFMHGVWTRHFPAVKKLRELVQDGSLGDIKHISIDFNQAASTSGEEALGEGALLETGVYPLALLDFVMDGAAPERMQVAGELSPAGAEKQVSMLCSYNSGATLAQLHCGLTVGTPREALFVGTKATAVLPYPFWCPTQVLVKRDGGEQKPGEEEYAHTYYMKAVPGSENFNFIHSEGFVYEIAEANRCLREGLCESPVVSAEFNRRLLATVEEARQALRQS